jgi:hypothetical protein
MRITAARAAASSGGLLVAAALAFSFSLTGCLQEEERKELLPSGVAVGHPVDTTIPGELPEGTIVAFGLKLPRRMTVIAQMDDSLFAVGAMRLEHVSNYIRSRVDAEKVETGPSKTVFREAKVRGGDKTVEVEVSLVSRGVQVVVRNKTRKPAAEGLSEKQRWERVGLTPDGKVLDDRLE